MASFTTMLAVDMEAHEIVTADRLAAVDEDHNRSELVKAP